MKRTDAGAATLALLIGVFFAAQGARAGNEANFVLYDHHTEAKGTTEINVFDDYSRGAPGDAPYDAQILEMERAITDQWMAALYLEGDKIDGEDYAFGGWRLESRYRLFSNSTLFSTSSTQICGPLIGICSRLRGGPTLRRRRLGPRSKAD